MAQLVKYNWQQTDRKVVVRLHTKDARNCRVEIRAELLIVSSEKFIFEFDLRREVNIYRSYQKITPQFVVVTLEKLIANERWTDLVKDAVVLYDRVHSIYVPIVPTPNMLEGEPSLHFVVSS